MKRSLSKDVKTSIRTSLRRFGRKVGVDVARFRGEDVGMDPVSDMRRFLPREAPPLILDVGANVGQSVDRFSKAFPASTIHAFEPSPTTYAELEAACAGQRGVTTWNYGVGSRNATLTFRENEYSVMSSFLEPGAAAWGKVVKSTDVEVVTLDSFVQQHGIQTIDILKSDTQGYEYEVLSGARELMKQNRIGLVYCEVNFADMYRESAPFHELFRFLVENHFSLVSIYQIIYQRGLAGWTDALFVNHEYYSSSGQR